MSDGVAVDSLLDLLKTTQKHLPWDGDFEVLLQKQNYPGLNQFVSKKLTVQGGTSYLWNVQYRTNGEAKATQMYAVDSPTIINTQTQAEVPWRQYTVNWGTNRQELMRQRGKAKLIDLVKSRRIAAMLDLADLLELDIWTLLASTGTTLKILPVGYWLPKRAASAADVAGGFTGENPLDASGNSFSTCAGIDASDTLYAKWKSYQARWLSTDGSISAGDLARIRKMFRLLKFESPTMVSGADAPPRKLRFYCNDTTMGALETAADSRNDRLGMDVASSAEATTIKGVPVTYVGQLDSDSTNPMYAINHNFFNIKSLAGDYFRETGPMNDRYQHDTFTTFVDVTMQSCMKNRQRGGGVISYQ